MTDTTSSPAAPREHREYREIDLAAFTYNERYKFLTASVIPRPIALVTTLDRNGVLNAAPFSSFVIIAVAPPLLGIVLSQVETGNKDTQRNILESGEFVINMVNEKMAAQVQHCSERFPPEVSEVQEAGLHTLASRLIAPARIAESHLQYECKLHRVVEFGAETSTLIVGQVVWAHAAEGLTERHRVDHQKLNALGRVGAGKFVLTNEVVHPGFPDGVASAEFLRHE